MKREIVLDEKNLTEMYYWVELYAAEVTRVVNVLNYWKENWKCV